MYKAKFFLLTVVLFAFLFSGASVASKGYQDIDAPGVKTLMEKEGALVVFPLSPLEFDDKHIKDSVNIIPAMMEYELPSDKERVLVFYCLGIKCVASWRAAEKAVELGYKNVYAFREGLPGWEKAGYPVVRTKKLPDVEVKKVSTDELSAALGNEDMVLLDINLDEDAHKFHIESEKRKHIPLDELNVSLPQIPEGKKIIVMCLKGKRSSTAAKYLMGNGFDDVAILDGGIQKWILEGRPVIRESAAQ